jgi:hypothetical protein
MNRKFKENDRIIAIRDIHGYDIKGLTGRIVSKSEGDYIVEFDKDVDGWNNPGCKNNHCLYVRTCDLKLDIDERE